MPAGGYRTFVAGEILDENDINDYLMQGVLVFAGSAARGSAIGSAVEGQVSFLKDSDTLEFYDGTNWVEISSFNSPAVVSGTTGAPGTGTYTAGGTAWSYYEFTGSGSITFSSAGLVEALLVGGGGRSETGSGDTYRTGGGAGGMIETGEFLIEAKTYTVTVGAGSGGSWLDGGDTIFANLVAVGGGAGYNTSDGLRARGRKGGSGSGSATVSGNVDSVRGFGISGQGNNGSAGGAGEHAGGGAGGAGSGSTPGAGKSSSITGSAVTYAQGGGDTTVNAANTGNGGRGSANGNSGVVVIRVRV